MTAIQLDELDMRLIKALARDARVSNRTIATELGVSEGTIRVRIKRLQAERLIAFTAVTGLQMARKSRLGFINIQADVAAVRRVMDALADMAEINCVMAMTGPFNILALCLFDELETLARIASDRIPAIPGVSHIETAIAVKTFKYNVRMVRITGDSAATDTIDPL